MQHRQTSLENMNTGKDMHGIGQLLVDFCGEQKLVIANTLFRLHNRHRYTWKNPDGATRTQSDYILMSKQWKQSIN